MTYRIVVAPIIFKTNIIIFSKGWIPAGEGHIFGAELSTTGGGLRALRGVPSPILQELVLELRGLHLLLDLARPALRCAALFCKGNSLLEN